MINIPYKVTHLQQAQVTGSLQGGRREGFQEVKSHEGWTTVPDMRQICGPGLLGGSGGPISAPALTPNWVQPHENDSMPGRTLGAQKNKRKKKHTEQNIKKIS